MLWHIYQHAFAIPQIFNPIRLIWIADLISLVEKYVNHIDWLQLKQKYPQLYNVLPLFHFISPWSETVLSNIPSIINCTPDGIGQEFTGWPRLSLKSQPNTTYWQILKDTFWPSEWWLRLYYGSKCTTPLIWYRYLKHPAHILSWVIEHLLERMGLIASWEN